MLRAVLNQLESDILGAGIVDVSGFTADQNFPEFEAREILPLKPRIALTKIPAEDLSAIHALEAAGFSFSEFQIRISLHIRKRPETPKYPYRFEKVTAEEDLAPALLMAGSIFTHDRCYNDPVIGPEIAGRRYQAYVRKSFASPDEHVYVMKNTETGAPVSFLTFLQVNPREVRLLIGGVANEFKNSGLGVIHDLLGLSLYYDLGVRTLHSAVSGINYPIMNLEIGHLGFKVKQSLVVLRKLYEAAPDA